MEAWQKAFLEVHERSRHSSPIMLTLFDQETVLNNHMAAVERETRLTTIKSLMKTMKWSPAEAMTAMEIPATQQAVYAAQL